MAPGVGPTSCPAAPVFYPSEIEFQDPLKYIASIRPRAEQFGIAKIVPPSSFHPPFAINSETFRFRTRIQAVHELQQRVGSSKAADSFERTYSSLLSRVGKASRRNPVFSGQELDLFKLHRVVSRRGGYDAVTESKGWKEVARIIGVSCLGPSVSCLTSTAVETFSASA